MNASAMDSKTAQPLDEVMLAMDVVDTLRRRERLVERELGDGERREGLRDRLRDIYASQGIDVPDHIIDEGVAALAEDRFVFDPPKEGFGLTLARFYVTRGTWGKYVGGIVAVVLVALLLNYLLVTRPNASLGDDLAAAHADIAEISQSVDATKAADDLFFAGKAGLANGDNTLARQNLTGLKNLATTLGQAYDIRIVNTSGENTAVWRIPDANTNARNYYAIVEAIDAAGKPVSVSVQNEETGQTEIVNRWGLRIDAKTFDQIADDKLDDGILQNDLFGAKIRGEISPAYIFPTTGGAITKW